MKIAVLSTCIENYVQPGSFRLRLLTAKKLAERGHDVVFISPANDSRRMIRKACGRNLTCYATPGLFPKRFRAGGFGFLDALFKAWLVWKLKVDVIQATNGHRPAQLIPSLVGKYVRTSVIVAECWEWLGKGGYADNRKGIIGKIIAFYDRLTELRVERVFDHIIAISSVLKKRFRDSGNVTVLRGGAENSELVSLDIDIARRRVRLSADSFIVGMSNVCSSDHKDNELFFEAFGKLSREHSDLFIVLTGSEEGYIKEVGRRYGFAEKVIFPGWVEFEIYNAYLSACNVFVLPLPNTPINAGRWPNKIGDYLCLNRPVLSNPTGDVEDLFREYRVGILCDYSSDGFYTALKALIEKENLEECSKAAPYVANETLAFDKRIESLLAIFKTELVGRGRSIEQPPCTD